MNFKKVIERFIGSSSKNVLILMTGTIFSQLISLFISPILTRIYTPEEYGILGVFGSFISIFAAIASLKFDAAVLLPKKDSVALKLIKLSSIIIIIVGLIALLALLFFQDFVLDLINTPKLKNYIYLSVISIWSIGFFNLFKSLLNRFESYKSIAYSTVSKSITSTSSQLGLGLLNFGFKGLVFGRVIGDAFSFFTSYFFLKKESRFTSNLEEPKTLKMIALEYQEFPKVTALHTFFNTVSASFPILILASFFTADVVGNFNQSIKIAFLPITLISASTYQVFSRKVTENLNTDKNIYNVTIETIKKLTLLGLIPFLVLMIFAPWLFDFIFGDQWRVAGEYTQLMVPYIFLVFIVSPLAYLPILRNKQRKAFLIEIIYLFLRIIALLIGVYFNNAYLAIGLYSLSGFLVQTYNLNWFFKLAKK
ncbi:MAG: oligosaccharide flippase family protein [Balneola sp.]|jgi:lipopolysaccharide exporter